MLWNRSIMGMSLIGLCVLLCLAPQASADGSPSVSLTPPSVSPTPPRDVIDKTNWEEAEELVPHTILNWVKGGQLILHLGELNYDPSVYLPQHALDARQTNLGKYAIDESGWIVEAATGNPAMHIIGYPFPEIDVNDPMAAEKIMHNKMFTWYVMGDFYFNYQLLWIGPSVGLERTVDMKAQQANMLGSPGVKDLKNPDKIEKRIIGVATAPMDVKGTAIMTWRYMSPQKQDSTFGYIPAIRRVRQMSPANRSDAIVGSDMCLDDSNGYDGKVQAFEWKLLRKQDAIVPYLDVNPQPLGKNQKGEWCSTKQQKYVVYGFEKEGWQGAKWAPTNYVWVKRPVYVIEMRSKDRYYNYGTQYLWIDAETYAAHYKVIYDRAGDYWKGLFSALTGYESPGKELRVQGLAHGGMVDDKNGHATGTELASPRNIVNLFVDLNERDFSIAGFQKFCQ